MALHWNVSKCKNHKALTGDDEWPITNALIWLSMSTGIRDITEENIPEIYARIRAWEDIFGAMLYTKNDETGKVEECNIEVEDLVKRIGLHTNASSLTRAEWRKGIANYLDREADAYKRIAERKMKEAA